MKSFFQKMNEHRLSPRAWRVFFYLYGQANEAGVFSVGLQGIQKYCGLYLLDIEMFLEFLADRGFIEFSLEYSFVDGRLLDSDFYQAPVASVSESFTLGE